MGKRTDSTRGTPRTATAERPLSIARLRPEPLPVTVVIPAHERADLVARAVLSAERQVPRPPAEILVVDDCSSDRTGAVARAAGATVIRHEVNQGEGAARNTAIAAASYPWVALLDSDDEWLPGHLAQIWDRREGHVAVTASAVAIGGTRAGEVLGHPSRSPRVISEPRDLVFPANPIPASGVLARRDAILAAGGFRSLSTSADIDMWVRLVAYGPILVCPEVGYRYHIHDGQVSSSGSRMREGFLDRVEEYARLALLDDRTVENVRVSLTWDACREALSSRDVRGAFDGLRWIAADPRHLRAFSALVTWRAGLRRRSRVMVGGLS